MDSATIDPLDAQPGAGWPGSFGLYERFGFDAIGASPQLVPGLPPHTAMRRIVQRGWSGP